MNSKTTLSQIRRSVTAALAFAAILLSVGCSTMTSSLKVESDKSAYAKSYGEVHQTMERLLAEADPKTAAQPTPTAASIASSLSPNGALASNP